MSDQTIGAAIHGMEAAGAPGVTGGWRGGVMIGAASIPHHRRIEQALRERMQRLADEGLVARRPGRGSFVAQPSAHRRANRLMTFSQEMRRRGMTPTSVVLARDLRPAGRAEAATLGLRDADPIAPDGHPPDVG